MIGTRHRAACAAALVVGVLGATGCSTWQGLNSLPMPGTQGSGPGSFEVKAQLPDIGTIEENSRVRVGDANIGTITGIEREGWHALVTMRLNGDVNLPANATAMIGQTSLLGSLHLELAPPTGVPPVGRLHNGSLIPLSSAGAYPGTDQTLAALSTLLNGGAIGQIQDITTALATGFAGREQDMRSLVQQIDEFTTRLNGQTGDIISAIESLNHLVGQVAAQNPVLDKALQTIPDALEVVSKVREQLAEAADKFGKFSQLASTTVDQTKPALVRELNNLAPVIKSLADAGPALTRSLSALATYPFPKENIANFVRGDYVNFTAVIDLTLSRIDNSLFTGTRFECELTELEMQWGRTVGMTPSPCTVNNPLTAPYHLDQGP